MPKEERDWLVFFTDDGLEEVQKSLAHHLHEGLNGFYISCKQVNIDQPFLHMIINDPMPDGSIFELEIYVPYHHVKLMAAGTEKRLIGFTNNAM